MAAPVMLLSKRHIDWNCEIRFSPNSLESVDDDMISSLICAVGEPVGP